MFSCRLLKKRKQHGEVTLRDGTQYFIREIVRNYLID